MLSYDDLMPSAWEMMRAWEVMLERERGKWEDVLEEKWIEFDSELDR